jgi:hypothetical protein
VIYEARSLRDDVDAWIESLQLATLEHERVQVGNRAYAYAMKVSILLHSSPFFVLEVSVVSELMIDPIVEDGLWLHS